MNKPELAARIKQAAYLEGDFVLSSGRRSKYYFDKYLFTTKPELLGAVARLVAEMLPGETARIAGAELGAVPLAAAVSLQTRLPFVIVKKQTKDYGTSKPIEGVLEPGDKVTLVEDIITTAGQCIKAANALKAAGADVIRIIGIIDRQEGGAENIRQAGFDYEPLFVKTDLGV
jgi:orotate phosphoribosyltransferase